MLDTVSYSAAALAAPGRPAAVADLMAIIEVRGARDQVVEGGGEVLGGRAAVADHDERASVRAHIAPAITSIARVRSRWLVVTIML